MSKPLHIFTQSNCLSHKELIAYHSGKLSRQDTHRVEEHLVDCELCSQALAGMALVPFSENDVNELHREIDARSAKGGGSTGFSGKIIIAGITAIAAVGTVLFYNKVFDEPIAQPGKSNVIAEAKAPREEKKDMPVEEKKAEVPEDIRDKSVVTKKASAIFPKENFTEKKEPVPEPKKPEEVPAAAEKNPLNAPPMNPADKKEIPQPEEPVAEPEYNAPVDYIHDLKVTDIRRFYYKDVMDMRNPSHLPSQFESQKNMELQDHELARTQSAMDILKKGLLYFKDKNFNRANEQFALLIENNKNDVNALFYSAISFYNAEKPDLALKYLDRVLLSTNNVFHEEALWYKALALLRKKDNEKAKEVLNEIVKGKGFYAKQAKEKLKTGA